MPRIAPEQLLARLEKGKPIPAIFLLGDEPYLRDACRAELIEKLVPEAARVWAVARYSAAQGEVQRATGQAQTLPMLSAQQLVFLEDMGAVEDLGEEARERIADLLAAYLDDPAPFTTLILEAGRLDQRMKLAKLLAEKTLVVDVGLGENQSERQASAAAIARKLAGDLGVGLEEGAAEDLADLVAADLQRLKTEIEKLATFAGSRKLIRRQDVAAMVLSERAATVWEWADLLAAGQSKKALEFLERLLREGEEPVALVGAMAWMYRKLIEASELKGTVNPYQAARALGMRPDSAALAIQNSRKIPRARLLDGLQVLHECDSRLKGGNASPRAILDFLIARLTRREESAG